MLRKCKANVVASKDVCSYNEITKLKEDFIMKLSDKLMKLRKRNGWSQEELAEKLNVSRQAISRWENETAQPDASNVLSLSRLFGVTADYLLNDDYESDFDVPVVKQTQSDARDKIKKVITLCVGMFGLIGNFVVYVLSRLVEVMVPRIAYENGQKIYYWASERTGHSYKYFVQEYDLEFLIVIFWILFIFGIVTAFVPKEKFKILLNKLKNVKRRKS
jgi:transcriptional regulator with XRE-family HTH domain